MYKKIKIIEKNLVESAFLISSILHHSATLIIVGTSRVEIGVSRLG